MQAVNVPSLFGPPYTTFTTSNEIFALFHYRRFLQDHIYLKIEYVRIRTFLLKNMIRIVELWKQVGLADCTNRIILQIDINSGVNLCLAKIDVAPNTIM